MAARRQARIGAPSDVVINGGGRVFISDMGNGVVRAVEAGTGIISTLPAADRKASVTAVRRHRPS